MQFCLSFGYQLREDKRGLPTGREVRVPRILLWRILSRTDLDRWNIISNLSAITKTRSITLHAKQAATVQEISNGRLQFRTGAGATRNYAIQWWYPYGIDYPDPRVRVSLLNEGLEVLRLLWSKSNVYFTGKYYRINGASLKNPNKPIPITVAAMGKKMI